MEKFRGSGSNQHAQGRFPVSAPFIAQRTPLTFTAYPANVCKSTFLQRASSARCHTHTFSAHPALDTSSISTSLRMQRISRTQYLCASSTSPHLRHISRVDDASTYPQ